VSWNAGLSIYAVTTNIRSVSARHAFLSQVLPANLQQHVAEFCRVATLPEPWKVLWENVGVHDSLEESSSEDDDPD
jgi:hypothetical protein